MGKVTVKVHEGKFWGDANSLYGVLHDRRGYKTVSLFKLNTEPVHFIV